MAKKSNARAGKVLLNGIKPNGAIKRTAAAISAKLLILSINPGEASHGRRCGRLTRSRRCTQTPPRFRAACNFSEGKTFCAIRRGSHRLTPKRRVIPMSRIAAPNTVLTPGIETGTKNTMVRKAVRIKRPS